VSVLFAILMIRYTSEPEDHKSASSKRGKVGLSEVTKTLDEFIGDLSLIEISTVEKSLYEDLR
jgi:hypothetical protein